jgi:thymidylate kinase
MFIFVFEGIDFAGKTTLIDELYDILRRSRGNTVRYRQPDNELVRHAVCSDNFSPWSKYFYCAADYFAQIEKIEKECDENTIVLMDRYFPVSSWVYSGMGDDLPGFQKLHDTICNVKYLKKQKLFILLPDRSVIKKRIARAGTLDRGREQKLTQPEYFETIYHGYETVAALSFENPGVIKLDSTDLKHNIQIVLDTIYDITENETTGG